MKKVIVFISEIVIDLTLIPFFFIKLFHEIGVFPSVEGETIKKHFYYSIVDNLKATYYGCLVYVGISLIATSIFLSAISIISKENKNLRFVAHIFFGFALVFFFALVIISSTVTRCY